MLSRQCPFCENVNPLGAKFCNACGLKLHAALCPHCGAVNALTATTCTQCAEVLEPPGASQPAAQAEATAARPLDAPTPAVARPAELDPYTASAAVENEKPVFSVHFGRDHAATIDRYDLGAVRPGLPPPVAANPAALPMLTNFVAEPPGSVLNGWAPQVGAPLVPTVYSVTSKHHASTPPATRARHPGLQAAAMAAIVLALLAGSSYFLYREHSRANLMGLISSSGGPPKPAQPSGADAAPAPPRTPAVKAAAPVAAAAPATAAVPTTQAPPPANASESVDRPAPLRPQVASKEAAAAVAAAAARPKTANAGGTRQPQRFEPCTEAVAALGLCAAPSATPARQ